MRNPVIWWRTSYQYMHNVACQASWRHLSSGSRGPKARAFVQYSKDCTWPIKARIRKCIYPIPIDKKSHPNHRHTCRLTPSFRRHLTLFGDSSSVCALFHCSNERLEYYVASDKSLWCHQCTVTTKNDINDAQQCTWTLSRQVSKIVQH